MSDKRDIGKIFSEKLKNFEAAPSSLNWEDIEAELPSQGKFKIPYWIIASGAVFLLGATILFFYISDEKKPLNPSPEHLQIVLQEEKEVSDCDDLVLETENNNNNKQFNTPTETQNNIKVTQTQPDTTTFDSSSTEAETPLPNGKKIEKPANTNIVQYKTSSNNYISKNTIKTSPGKSSNTESIDNQHNVLSTILAQESKLASYHPKGALLTEDQIVPIDTIKNAKTFTPKYSIGIHLAPTYHLNPDGSLISDNVAQNSNTGDIGNGFGIVFNADLSKRLSSRIGYNHFSIKNEVKDITPVQFPSTVRDIAPNIGIDTLATNSSLSQKISFHEISMELGYLFLDKKVQASFIGGLSFVIQNSSEIKLSSPMTNISLGNNDKLQKTNFSINFGTNFKYPIYNNIYLSITPFLKYQLQDASQNRTSYRPLYIQLQTGFSYQF